MHIPKTAGSTLHGVIRRQYPRNQTIVADLMGRAARDKFREIPEERRRNLRLLLGHMAFGVHELLPGDSTYLTMIRHPVDRTVSFFYWAQQTPDISLHEPARDSVDVAAFVEGGAGWIYTDNGLTRFLSGQTFAPLGSCDETMLATAKKHIEDRFAAVGLTERFDESLHLFREALGWKRSMHYADRKVTRNRPRLRDLPPKTIAAIERHSELDLDLYDFVMKEFEARLTSDSIRESVDRFRRLNALFKVTYPMTIPVRRTVKKLMGRKDA